MGHEKPPSSLSISVCNKSMVPPFLCWSFSKSIFTSLSIDYKIINVMSKRSLVIILNMHLLLLNKSDIQFIYAHFFQNWTYMKMDIRQCLWIDDVDINIKRRYSFLWLITFIIYVHNQQWPLKHIIWLLTTVLTAI